jgi:hypothetical protein
MNPQCNRSAFRLMAGTKSRTGQPVTVVNTWTGRHALALRTALRLTNEGFANALGTATRTVAKWNADPDTVPIAALQRQLDSVLANASDEAQARFDLLLGAQRGDSGSDGDHAAEFLRLDHDPGVCEVLNWLDTHAGWPTGEARSRTARRLSRLDRMSVTTQALHRGTVSRHAIATALASYYSVAPYQAVAAGGSVRTSILTHPDWLDLRLPLGQGNDRLVLDAMAKPDPIALDEAGAQAAVDRLADAIQSDTRVVNTPLYRLRQLDVRPGSLTGVVALSDFTSYAMTMDLLETELSDVLAAGRPVRPGALPLRDRYLPTTEAVEQLDQRLCAGGALALLAAARPGSRSHPGQPDYLLLIQERSGRVLNAARRLAVIPKSFHEPLVDFSDDAQLSATLERELEEELFGRAEVDSTSGRLPRADPLHLTRLSEPMRWLMENTAAWRVECTGFGLNLVSGNYEFACLIVIEDESWWARYGGHIEANWETEGLRRYSTLDRELIGTLIHDPAWSNEGLFAFLQGLRRLAELNPERVNVPTIELEL